MSYLKKNVFFRCCLFWLGICSVQSYATTRNTLPTDELKTFAEVFNTIKTSYVQSVSDKKLFNLAIKGMTEGLDPHSDFLSDEEFIQLREATSGQFGGLGIEVGLVDGMLKIIAPLDDTPAKKAGIEAGDIIIKIDDKSTQGMSLLQAVKKMRGEPGEPILLTLMRANKNKPLQIKLTRAIIQIKSVRYDMLEPGYGYIRITNFQINTPNAVIKALKSLIRKAPSGKLKGLVLDLRNNPGGVLQSAVEVSDLFIPKGLIVYTKGRIKSADIQFEASGKACCTDVQMVVLINGGAASASEIVAGALQDHHRAVIMGTTSFGKGSVQTVLSIRKQQGLKLTTALYYTPSGRSIQAMGIVPDIIVPQSKVVSMENKSVFKEVDLDRHIHNKIKRKKTLGSNNKKPENLVTFYKDYQLQQALNMLKGLYLVANKK